MSASDSQAVTIVTRFTVAPENQQRLIDIVIRAVEEEILRIPGFISTKIHKSMDGTHVLNYSQWESREAFESTLQRTDFIPYVQEILLIATLEPDFYEMVAEFHGEGANG